MCRYFSLQATGCLRFDDSVRQEVESNICSEHGVTTDCFSTPRHIVYCYIERVSCCCSSSSVIFVLIYFLVLVLVLEIFFSFSFVFVISHFFGLVLVLQFQFHFSFTVYFRLSSCFEFLPFSVPVFLQFQLYQDDNILFSCWQICYWQVLLQLLHFCFEVRRSSFWIFSFSFSIVFYFYILVFIIFSFQFLFSLTNSLFFRVWQFSFFK